LAIPWSFVWAMMAKGPPLQVAIIGDNNNENERDFAKGGKR